MIHLKTFLLIYFTAIGLCTVAVAGLKIYYFRHGQEGHNVKKAWEKKDVPKSEWPAYVGNAEMVTPTARGRVLSVEDV